MSTTATLNVRSPPFTCRVRLEWSSVSRTSMPAVVSVHAFCEEAKHFTLVLSGHCSHSLTEAVIITFPPSVVCVVIEMQGSLAAPRDGRLSHSVEFGLQLLSRVSEGSRTPSVVAKPYAATTDYESLLWQHMQELGGSAWGLISPTSKTTGPTCPPSPAAASAILEQPDSDKSSFLEGGSHGESFSTSLARAKHLLSMCETRRSRNPSSWEIECGHHRGDRSEMSDVHGAQLQEEWRDNERKLASLELRKRQLVAKLRGELQTPSSEAACLSVHDVSDVQ